MNLTPYLNMDLLLGYRYMRLDEDLNITDNLVPIAGSITFLGNSITAPNTVSDADHFSTTNRFNGVNMGTRFRWQSGFDWLAFTGYGKFAVGAMQQTVDIQGTSATGGLVTNGGILALSSNIGTHERTVFGAIPEGRRVVRPQLDPRRPLSRGLFGDLLEQRGPGRRSDRPPDQSRPRPN